MYRITYRRMSRVLPALLLAITLAGSALAGPYVLGELVLKMQPGHSIDEINLSFGTVVAQHLVQTDVYLLNTSTSADLDSLAALIESTDAVKFCHPNYRIDPLQPVQSSLPVSDELGSGSYTDQAAATRLDLTATHEFATGANVRVAVLDGGIDHTHPALQSFAVSGYDYVDDDTDAMDLPGGPNSGHGTFVSGVVHLVAPTAELRAYRVTDLNGESNGYLVAEAILKAVDDNCQVINLSMVTTGVHEAMAEAIAYAAAEEVLVVVAAGNGHDGGTAYPASDSNAFCVAALDTADLLADFSNYGDYIDICAPGVEIYSAYLNHGYAWWGGTSFAAPFVAAQAALLLEYDSTATRQAIIDAISATAEDVYDANGDYIGQLGAGLIDPLASLIALRGSASHAVPGDYPTIQAAIDAAQIGDTILVSPGTYTESILISQKLVYLISSDGPETTFLQTADIHQQTLHILNIALGEVLVSGFSFDGLSYAAVLDIFNSKVKVTNCHFAGLNPGSGMSAVYVEKSNLDMAFCSFYDIGGSQTIHFFPVHKWASLTLRNNTFHDMYRAVMINTTEYPLDTVKAVMKNNIFTSNSYRAIECSLPITDGAYNLFHANYMDFSSAIGGSMQQSVLADPLYLFPDSVALWLQITSPAVDAGDPDPEFNDPDGSRNDIGAFPLGEGYPAALSLALVDAEPGRVTTSTAPSFQWDYQDLAGAPQQQVELQIGADDDWSTVEFWDSGPVATTASTLVYGGSALPDLAQYHMRIRVNNGTEWGPWFRMTFAVSAGTFIRVPLDAPTISDAVAVASSGDTILVSDGIYYEEVSLPERQVTLLSENGAAATIIESDYPLIIGALPADSAPIVRGFTLRADRYAVQLYNDASITLDSIIIVGAEGNGVQGYGQGTVVIANTVFDSTDSPIRKYYGNLTVRNSTFRYCTGMEVVYHSSGSVLDFQDNLLFGNTADQIIEGSVSDSLLLVNNTVANNTATYAVVLAGAANSIVTNNLLVGNGTFGFHTGYSTAPIELAYNNSFGHQYNYSGQANAYEDDNLQVNPNFFDTASGDFSLVPGSPCIDAGNPDPIYNDPDGSRADIGAVWTLQTLSHPLPAGIAASPTDDQGNVTDSLPTVSWTYTDSTGGSQSHYQLQVGTDNDWSVAEIWDSGPVASSQSSVAYAGPALVPFHPYIIRVRLNNGAGWGSWLSAAAFVRLGSVVRVPMHYPSIGDAVPYTRSGDTILVAPGTYPEAIRIERKSLVLLSEQGPANTVLVPLTDSTARILEIMNTYDANSVIEGFTFDSADVAVYVEASGLRFEHNIVRFATTRGLHVVDARAGLLVRHNTFTDNYQAVWIYQPRVLTSLDSNLFVNNVGRGAVNLDGYGAQVVGNRFVSNASPNLTTNAGGLVVNRGHFTIHNNTFYDNGPANSDLRVFSQINSADIRNNIFAFALGTSVRIDDSSKVTVAYNDLFGGALAYAGIAPGEGDIAANPLFADTAAHDFTLAPGSPCIDAGDTALAFVEIDWTRCDMGALSSAVQGNMPMVTQFGVLTGDPARLIDSLPILTWSYEDTLGGQSAFELQVGTDFIWNDPEDWLPGPIASSETSCPYAGSPLARGIDYYARLRLFNGATWGGWNGLLLHRNSLVPAPTNGGPISGMAPLSTPLTVRCPEDPEGDSLFFDFELYTDSLYDSLLAVFTQLPGKVSPVVENLLPATTYYWRARTFDGYEYSDWSTRFSFLTVPEAGAVLLATAEETSVPCGQPISFNLAAVNDQSDTVMIMFNGFRVYSPDGAFFDSVQASWVNDQIVWSQAFNLGTIVEHHHGPAADSIGFFALGFTGPGLPPHTSAAAFRLETEIDCSETGRTICLERCLVDGSFPWLWDNPGSPGIGMISPVWGGPYCFTVEECCVGERGNVNGDDQNGNLSDVTYLINYLFLDGPPPPCFAEANINGDPSGTINLTDLTLLVNHAFVTFAPLPQCDEVFITPVTRSAQADPVALTATCERDTTIVTVASPLDLLGLQLTLSGQGTGDPALSLPEPFALYHSVTGPVMTAGILDPASGAALPAARHELLRIPGHWDILDALAVDRDFQEHVPTLTAADDLIPQDFELSQNYPNPFNPSTTIRFGLPVASAVKLEIFNILGQRVIMLADRRFDAGYHDIIWDGAAADGNLAASGVYFYRLHTGSYTASRKMILLK